MQLGDGIALATVAAGFFGTAMVAIAKFVRRNNGTGKYVTTNVCDARYESLKREISGIGKKIDAIYDYLLKTKKL